MVELRKYFAKTDSGPYLNINEDDYSIDISNNLFLILDGFGGSNIGNKAVSFLKEEINGFFTKMGKDPESTFPFSFSYKHNLEGNCLLNSMQYAHTNLYNTNAKKILSARGGSSAIGVAASENILTFASTGNCISYLYRKGHLSLITYPDNLKFLSDDNYQTHFYTCPMSGFGLFEQLHLQIRELRIFENDLIIMLSDGAYGRVKKEEMKFIINKYENNNEKIIKIFELSNSRGNLDNQTSLILQF